MLGPGKAEATEELCNQYFEAAVNATGIVHPRDILLARVSQARASLANWPSIRLPSNTFRLPTCEACVHWDGNAISVTRTSLLNLSGVYGLRGGREVYIPDPGRKYIDAIRIRWLDQILRWARPPPLNVSIFTANNSWCVLPDGSRAVAVESSASPDGSLAQSVLLPLEPKQWEQPLRGRGRGRRLADWQPPFSFPPRLRCRWRGSHSGDALLQSWTTRGRRSCLQNETDRQCVVNQGLRGVKWDEPVMQVRDGTISFGGNLAQLFAPPGQRGASDDDVFADGCVLAIDGNSYASIFGDALARGKLVVRVGGYRREPASSADLSPGAAGERLSYYQWFEPLLVSGRHYVQTTVDELPETVRRVQHMPLQKQRRIAKAAHEAASWLFSLRGRRCYNLLALTHVPKPYECDLGLVR